MVLVEIQAGGQTGIGYTYADKSTGTLADSLLQSTVHGRDVFRHNEIWLDLLRMVRNSGECGISHMAIAAIDNALWDLRGKLLNTPVVHLLGAARAGVPVYGSGGFTSCSHEQLADQLGNWAQNGFRMVKMKVGTHPDHDLRRVKIARQAIGQGVKLFVDANGAYTVAQAIPWRANLQVWASVGSKSRLAPII